VHLGEEVKRVFVSEDRFGAWRQLDEHLSENGQVDRPGDSTQLLARADSVIK